MATTEQRTTGAEDVAWDLSDLFAGAGDPKLEAELAGVARSADSFRARYHGRMVDFADASLVVLSDLHPALPVVTADRNDFAVYLRSRSPRILVTR